LLINIVLKKAKGIADDLEVCNPMPVHALMPSGVSVRKLLAKTMPT
jgi:hypothetical protein